MLTKKVFFENLDGNLNQFFFPTLYCKEYSCASIIFEKTKTKVNLGSQLIQTFLPSRAFLRPQVPFVVITKYLWAFCAWLIIQAGGIPRTSTILFI